MKITDAFRDAEALAEFANLDPADSNAVNYFKNNYPDFAPPEWWNYQFEETQLLRVNNAGEPTQEEVPQLPWEELNLRAALEDHLELIWQDAQFQIQRSWQDQFKFDSVFILTQLLKAVFVAPAELVVSSAHLLLPDGELYELSTPTMYSFHKAVLYLHQNPWRAKICKACEKHFVANHPQRDFCQFPDARGETCRHKNDLRRKLGYYHTTGKQERQAKSRKSGPRLPGSRREKRTNALST